MYALLQELEKASDRRAIFLNCYLLMTQNVLESIQEGEFNDPDWVDTLLHRFADYYFEALTAYELNDPATPAVWQLAHRAAGKSETSVLQNLLLGINAHINYDLVLTLVDLLEPEWRQLSADRREQRHSDYCQVNQIIRYTIDAVQDDVVERYSPIMDLVDKMLGSLDEWLISQLITKWRDEVWDKAVGMMTTVDIEERRRLLDRLETTTLDRAKAIQFKGRL
ncbi:MAG: DUF5995 family protein [Anaerolineae bacterium]|nr:DUF5995 family protein [Anaerolineae bacterium]